MGISSEMSTRPISPACAPSDIEGAVGLLVRDGIRPVADPMAHLPTNRGCRLQYLRDGGYPRRDLRLILKRFEAPHPTLKIGIRIAQMPRKSAFL